MVGAGIEDLRDKREEINKQIIKDEEEKANLFNAIDTVPCIGKKAEWALNWMGSDKSFATRLVGFACVEGIFFSGAFCSIFWLKKRGTASGTDVFQRADLPGRGAAYPVCRESVPHAGDEAER